MDRLKVGYVVKRFPRASETFIAQEILGLERRGVDVTVLALRPNDHEVEHDWLKELKASVHTYPEESFSAAWRSLQRRARRSPQEREGIHRALLEAFDHPERSGRRYLVEALWIVDLVERHGLEHLHAHFANHPAFVAMLSHLIGEVSYSFTAHAKDIFSAGPGPDLWRKQVRHAAFAVTVSDANRAHLRSVLGPRLSAKLHRLYNGVDLERIVPAAHREVISKGTRVLLASRLVEKKGADLLIDAVTHLRRDDTETEFIVVGDGPESARLKDRARLQGVADRVRFTGALPHQELVDLMSGSDLFVLPCRVAADGDRDALPTVLIEAMASGLPCISTPVNGVTEILDHGESGLLVPENDAGSLALAIRSLLGDPGRRAAMGRAARRQAEARFDRDTNVSVLHEWFGRSVDRAVKAPAAPLTIAVSN